MQKEQNNLQQLKLRKSAEQWEKGVFIYVSDKPVYQD